MKYFIAIPTFNGGILWKNVAKAIREYSPQDILVQVIDSGSTDKTVDYAKDQGFELISINSKDFNHGATRNLAVDLHKDKYDIVIFLTQDALPTPFFVEKIIKAFDDPMVSCAYGRQLPHSDANPIAKHARLFNYTNNSYTSSIRDVPSMGLKTVFISNSFAAYRISSFEKIGGFPSNTILSEDMYFAAKSVLNGYKVAYIAEAMVRHSHNYSLTEEFKRYFDIGVFHADQQWIRNDFGGAGGEGKRFLISEFLYLIKSNPLYLFRACALNALKITGYKLGQSYNKLPPSIVKKLSMHKRYWE
ncbi:glycosyltransferase family 2 protein [Klebsiella pneumoniae]